MSKTPVSPEKAIKGSELDDPVFIIYKEDDGTLQPLATPEAPPQLDIIDQNSPVKIFNFDGDLNPHMESSNHLVSEASEYAEHFLSQLTADPLVLSSSQVSSVLLELEPNQTPTAHIETTTIAKDVSGRCLPPLTSSVPLTSLLPPPSPPVLDKKKPACNIRYHAIKCVKVTLGQLSWYRCSVCPFLATTQDLISSHYINLHIDSISAHLRCINCELTFNRLQTLKHHYIIDHLVSLNDLKNLTKLTVEANKCWRDAKIKGKKEDGAMVDSIIPEIITGEEEMYSEEECLRATGADPLNLNSSPLPPPLLLSTHPPSSATPPLTTMVEKWLLSSVDHKFPDKQDMKDETDSHAKRLKEEDAKKAEIKAEREKKSTWKCSKDGCLLKFTSESNLEYHKICHQGVSSQWKCPECSEVVTKWSQLSIHLWRSHELDIDLYSCDLCHFKTNNLSKLMKLHRRTHGTDRPYLCDSCGLGFKTTKQLGTHKIYHSKSKKTAPANPVNCSVCSRKFADLRLLRTHMDIVHRGLKPYVCDVCNHSAASKSSLKMHHRSHTGEKPYSCPDCSYSTADHNSFRRHKMRHSGAKHYKCPHCSYASIQSTTFKDHLRNQHPGLDEGLMFSCKFCSFRTVNNEYFLTHISSHSSAHVNKSQAATKLNDISVESYEAGPPIFDLTLSHN